MAEYFDCAECHNVGPAADDGISCRKCGGKNGRRVSQQEFDRGKATGTYFPVDKSGKRMK
jgi:hypothetical protein